jgi:hypothetical protein
MDAFMILALGACVVSFLAGLTEVWAAPISRPEPEAPREQVKPQLPPEVIASLSRNARWEWLESIRSSESRCSQRNRC